MTHERATKGPITGPIALALAAAFFGIALYINLAEQPARLGLPDGAMLAAWTTSFRVGFMLQGATTVLAGLAGLLAWWFSRDWRWLVGGLAMLANWPWTLALIAPVNTALLAIPLEEAGAVSRALVAQWGPLHAGRTALSGLAVALFLWAMLARGQRA